MELSKTVLYLLSTRMDNNTLGLLSKTPLWDELNTFTRDQYWWYLRTQHLFNKQVKWRPERDWRDAYPVLLSFSEGRRIVPYITQNPLIQEVLSDVRPRFGEFSLGSFANRREQQNFDVGTITQLGRSARIRDA